VAGGPSGSPRGAVSFGWRWPFASALAVDVLRSPLAAYVDGSTVPQSLRPFADAIETKVVAPLKSARDDSDWADALDAALPTWLRLRLAFTVALLEVEGSDWIDTLEQAARSAPDVPLTLLPQPDYGAARFAIEMLAATSAQTLAAVRAGRRLDLPLLEALVEDIAIIELAWMTLAGSQRPAPAVASAAAWEAYSRVRPLRGLLARVGLDPQRLPHEQPGEAAERALAMLRRVSGGWTDVERAAVATARLPAGELQ
jgi:hypothetical protein